MTQGQGANGKLRFLAHRGYRACYPENTAESLTAAVVAGAEFIEFDVQMSRDGVPVVLHDPSLERTAGVDRLVFDLAAADLAHFEVNEQERLGEQSLGAFLPSLQDIAVHMAHWPEVTAFVELKPHSMTRFGASGMIDAVLKVLEPVLDRCVLISFVHDVVHVTRGRVDMPVGWVLSEWDEESRATVEAEPPEYLFVNERLLPAEGPVWPGPWTWVCYDIVKSSL